MNRRNLLKAILAVTGLVSVPAIATTTPQQSSRPAAGEMTIPEIRMVSNEVLKRYQGYHLVWIDSNHKTTSYVTNNGFYIVRMRFDFDTRTVYISDMLRGFAGPIPAHIQEQLT